MLMRRVYGGVRSRQACDIRGWMARFPRIAALVAGSISTLFGLWAFFAPQSFFDKLAIFEPYNRHFIHDIGSFQIAIGVMLILAVYATDGLFAALAGASVGQVFHLISHLIDKDLGQKQSTTIPFLVLIAIVAIAGAVIRARPRT